MGSAHNTIEGSGSPRLAWTATRERLVREHWRYAIAFLFTLTLTVRLAYRLVVLPAMQGEALGTPKVPAGPDPYDVIAQNVLAGNGFVTERGSLPYLRRGPGYVAYLIVVRTILGSSEAAIVVAHALTDAASTVVLILLATWVAGRPIVGMLAGLCFSLYPEAIRRTPGPATEPWFTFLLLLLCCALLWLFDNHTWRRAAVCGCLIGLMSLTRPSFQFFPIFLAGVILLRYGKGAWSAIRSQAVLALAFAMVVMPWTIRNYRVTGWFIPVTTEGPSDLYLGTQIEYGPDFFASREAAVARRLEVGHELAARGGGVDAEHRFLTLALQEIRSRPVRYARSVGHRLLGFWHLTQTRLGAVKNLAEHVPIYALAALGFVGLIGAAEGGSSYCCSHWST